jgi:hypothetical protein
MDGKVLDHLWFMSKVLPGPFTDLSAWVGFCTSSPGNTFDINHKWSRTLPSIIYFSWDIYRDPLLKPTAECQISTLTFELIFFYGGGFSINIP